MVLQDWTSLAASRFSPVWPCRAVPCISSEKMLQAHMARYLYKN